MNTGIQIVEKPDWVSWDDIHELLLKAHHQNITHGMTMRTVNLSGEELKERLGDGQCLVALDANNKLIGTASVQIKESNAWYSNGRVAKLMLGAILPEYQGHGIFRMLLIKNMEFITQNNVDVIVMDTAEHNTKMQNIMKRNGFRYVSCFASRYSKHYSIVMAKWLGECPYSGWYCSTKFHYSFLKLKLRFKPGHVKRFGI